MKARKDLWRDLLVDRPRPRPWCIGGGLQRDRVTGGEERGRSFVPVEGLEFMSFMEEAEIFDAGFTGPSFTWCNSRRGRSRVWKRLDRPLVKL